MTGEPLEAGDLVWVDFDPVRGTEQRGVRPALVISAAGYNAATQRSIVCPITNNQAEWPTKVALPPGCGAKGFVLADQVRCVDRSQRGFRKIGRAPREIVDAVQRTLMSLLSAPSD